ncbi:tetratricopeptide repeat protein [Spirosoma flavum]|uniref:Tetratricopeptide repeat protein n=1 Tax=Spirosoma flavum TaxID=2048557 RepID=A0ABW6AV29_9BACT
MNVRTNLIQWTLFALPFLSAAQPKQLIISARSGDSVRPVRPDQKSVEAIMQPPAEASSTDVTATASESLNILPLFGEQPKTAAQIDEEVHFLNDCDRNFASRPEASDFFAARGWDYVTNGQLDTAAHRFNLSWLLNDRNADAYWGLGVICYQKNQLTNAIRMLKKGLAVADSNVVLMIDLATIEIKQYQEKPTSDMLTEAEGYLQRAVSISPSSAPSYQKLSVVSYLKADYLKAWDYFHQARNLDLSVLDLSYLSELLAKHPDPKGVFK